MRDTLTPKQTQIVHAFRRAADANRVALTTTELARSIYATSIDPSADDIVNAAADLAALQELNLITYVKKGEWSATQRLHEFSAQLQRNCRPQSSRRYRRQ